MSAKSGLIALANGARSYLEAYSVTCNVGAVTFGMERDRQINQADSGANRILFISGKFKPNQKEPAELEGGKLEKPRNVRANPENARELACWRRKVTISVWAADPNALESEEAQIEATEALAEWAIRSVHYSFNALASSSLGFADVIWGDTTWTIPPGELAYGRELLIEFTHSEAIYDRAVEKAYPHPAVSRTYRQP